MQSPFFTSHDLETKTTPTGEKIRRNAPERLDIAQPALRGIETRAPAQKAQKGLTLRAVFRRIVKQRSKM